jgi:hypothetical protein
MQSGNTVMNLLLPEAELTAGKGKVSGFQGFRVSGFQGFQAFRVSSFKVSRFQGFKGRRTINGIVGRKLRT